jgi:hypothetical protein
MPVPVVAHIVSVTVYAVLGAFQFSPALRRRRIGWHRAAGRLLVAGGLVVAVSGLWLTLFLPRVTTDSGLLVGVRVAVSLFMIGSIGLGVAAVLRRDIARHRAWMIRAYAIAMGAGTQAFTQAPWVLLVGPVDQRSRVALMTAAWLVNIAVAEWIIRRPIPANPRSSAGKAVAIGLQSNGPHVDREPGASPVALGRLWSWTGSRPGRGRCRQQSKPDSSLRDAPILDSRGRSSDTGNPRSHDRDTGTGRSQRIGSENRQPPRARDARRRNKPAPSADLDSRAL